MLLFCLVFCGPAFGQSPITFVATSVEARLSGWCRSVDDAETANGPGDFRVRRGGRLASGGNRQTLVVEDGGRADVNGAATVVYVMKGGTASVGGERNTVYAEDGANVLSRGPVQLTRVLDITVAVHRNAPQCQ